MGVRIRSADRADRPSLEIVRQQAIEGAYGERYDRAAVADLVATPEAELDAWIDDDRHVVLVVETDVTQVGYAVGDPETGRIDAIYVAPDYERRGYGSEVMAALEMRFHDAGVETVTVETPVASMPFFHRLGFERVGDVEAGSVPRVRLEKPLSGARELS